METDYTAGPWLIKQDKGWPFTVQILGDNGNCCVLMQQPWNYGTGDSLADVQQKEVNKEYFANIKLMATAPELLDALQEAKLQIEYLHNKFQETGSGNSVLLRIDQAISKATLK